MNDLCVRAGPVCLVIIAIAWVSVVLYAWTYLWVWLVG